ncbi:MAG: cell division protein FtsH, partial [Alkalispirochaeta sp.]
TTTGVQNDLKQATDLARRMVTEWGMSNLGAISFGQEDEPIFIGKEIASHKDFSESTAQSIDQEIARILNESFREAETILGDHRDQLETLAQALVEKETLSDREIREMLGFPARRQLDMTGDGSSETEATDAEESRSQDDEESLGDDSHSQSDDAEE